MAGTEQRKERGITENRLKIWLHTHTHVLNYSQSMRGLQSAVDTSDIHFMAVEDLLHPLAQSPSVAFTIRCTHDAITIHFGAIQIDCAGFGRRDQLNGSERTDSLWRSD